MDAQSKLEMVDRYLLGKMSPEEVKEFELLMQENTEINEFVDTQRKLIKGMEKYQKKIEFFDMLGEIKKDKTTAKSIISDKRSELEDGEKTQDARVRKLRFRIAYAAGFALLITAILFMLDTKVDPSDLASTHFSFHKDLLSPQLEASGATDDVNKALVPLLQQGIQYYNQQEYEMAKTAFQQFKAQSKGKNYLAILNDFYLAQIAFYQNQPEETIELLTPLQSERGLPIEASTKWYLALAYLKTHELNNARKLLNGLRINADYGPRVNEILNKLD